MKRLLLIIPLLLISCVCACKERVSIYYDVAYQYIIDELKYKAYADLNNDGTTNDKECVYVMIHNFHKVQRDGYWEHNNALYISNENVLVVYE